MTVAQLRLCSFHKIQKIAKKGLKSGNYGGIIFTVRRNCRDSAPPFDGGKDGGKVFIMAFYYEGTTREISVGDEVVGRGVCDERRLTGLVGTVKEIRSTYSYRGYVALVKFETGDTDYEDYFDCGYFTWWVCPEHIRPRDAMAEGTCYSCGGVLDKKSKLGSRLYKHGGLCDDCIAREIGTVHSYHFGKKLKYNVCADKITFGAEIEIDAPRCFDEDASEELARDCVKYARKKGYALINHFENDGSLRDGGVECPLAPLTIDDFKSDAVKAQLNYLFDRADELGFDFDADNHAGLHIHIGRKSLCGDDRSISDAVGLLMGWAISRLWDKGFNELCGRENLEYCKLFDAEKDGNGLRDTYATDDRYYCVNITNTRTIEMRIFNNATCYEDVILAVDVCYMLAKWSTKKINAFLKRGSYSAKSRDFTDALAYADRLTWSALVKYSKFPEITIKRMRACGIVF